MRLGIRSKLFIGALVLIGVAVAAAELYLSHALERQLTERIRGDMLKRAALIADRAATGAASLDEAGADALADSLGRIAGVRVTLVRPDGTVAGDSEVERGQLARLENHRERPEVLEAFGTGQGSSVRFSTTVSTRMMYTAVPMVRDGRAIGVARVALPLVEVDEAIAQMRRTLAAAALFALAVAALLSFSAAALTSRRLRELTEAARRMAAGNLDVRTRTEGHDEIVALGRALDQLADSLSRSLGELRGERDLLTGILSSMNEGVLVVGADRRVVLTNPALRAMLLIGPDPLGRSVLQVVRNAELNQLLENAAGGAYSEGEIDLAGLVRRRVLVRAVTLQDEPRGVLAVFVDVTELRRLEAVRRDFVANASHELRSPLTTIKAAAETLRDEEDTKAARRFVELIQRNAERLSNLIDDLLELSRIESRELKLELEPVDLHVCADRTLAQHAHRAQMKHITLTQEVPAGVFARADRRALDHVLGNLVDNALKYCPEGATVRVFADTAEGMVRVSVADSGPGIAHEHLQRVFERFYRVDTGRSRELGGTGLGLSIVKHLVEAMGGSVSVESRPGAGATFWFTLQSAAREAAA
ncbi:MAG TPA: ATP-binding protein [Burkholderiales bacterium]|nr:ATP-binding protein [Burkholderiales bacterium]